MKFLMEMKWLVALKMRYRSVIMDDMGTGGIGHCKLHNGVLDSSL